MANAGIEQIARRNTRRVVIVILRSRRGNIDPRGAVLSRSAGSERCGQSRELVSAEKACLDLLVGCQARQVYWRRGIGGKRYRSGHQAAVITPVEAKPRASLPHLVLDMRSLLELLVVVDAEHTSCRRTAQAADLRIEETRRGMPEN